MTSRRRLTGATLVALLATLLVALAPPTTAEAVPTPGGSAAPSACVTVSAQVDSLDAQAAALEAQIGAHNAQVVDTTNAAAVNAYNARAAELNGQRDALNAQIDALNVSVARCTSQDTQIQSALQSEPGDWTYRPSTAAVDALQQRLDGLDRSNVPLPTEPRRNGTWPMTGPMAPYYEAVRPAAPPRDRQSVIGNVRLQGRLRPAPGDPDPALPGRAIQGTADAPHVSPDHIVPLSEILTLPGFWQLDAQNMLLVLNAPINYQWLSYRANQSKQSRSATGMLNAEPAWIEEQLALREVALQRLQQAIDLMLEQQQTVGS